MDIQSNPETQKIHLSFITPEKTVFDGEVSMVVIPGEEGEFGVLPRHMAFVSLLKEGDVKIYQGQKITQTIPITGGVAEVNSSGCRILADGLVENMESIIRGSGNVTADIQGAGNMSTDISNSKKPTK